VQTALDTQPSVLVTRSEGATAVVIYRGAVAYIEDAPPGIVSAISPESGTDGTVIQITGSGLTGATDVTFSGASASSMSVVSDSAIQAVVPFGGEGLLDVVVVTPAGTIPAGVFDRVS
jgi:hypothetical protein